MALDALLRTKCDDIRRIAARHGVARVWVFGSRARGEAKPESDVDLLIEVTGPTTPWFPGGLVAELEALIGRRVDAVEADALEADVRDQALREAVAL